MPIKYRNFKNQEYFLHNSLTKTGKEKYYFSTKKEGILVDNIPNRYEIYENPNGQVFLRRIQPKLITEDDIKIIEEGIKKYSAQKKSKIDIKKDMIIIYTPDQNVDELAAILNNFHTGKNNNEKELLLNSIVHYSPVFQFVLADDQKRLFITRRYCYLSSIDDWIEIGKVDRLPNLCRKYLKHIGQDSYFELD